MLFPLSCLNQEACIECQTFHLHHTLKKCLKCFMELAVTFFHAISLWVSLTFSHVVTEKQGGRRHIEVSAQESTVPSF